MRAQLYHDEQQGYGMTFGVQMLLIANIGAYIAELLFGIPMKQFGALRSDWLSHGAFWELVTYQFVHQGIRHIFFNMLALFMFGPELERGLGTNRFFRLYILSGILGGVAWSSLAQPWEVCVGASGAVFGLLAGYAALYPNREIILLIFPFTPIKAWVLILGFGLYQLLETLFWPGKIATTAHIGGGITGYIYALSFGRPDILQKIKRYFKITPPQKISQAEIDRILDKASKHGIQSLTKAEKTTLKRAKR